MKKLFKALAIAAMALTVAGCGRKVQIFVEKPADHSVQVKAEQMERDAFYVKDGTMFASVYLPNGNATKKTSRLNTSRVLYFVGDEKMVPTHYKGEILAYKSADIKLKESGISLERFKDVGYSIGIYGGQVGNDGYYHMSVKNNCAAGSSAQKTFGYSSVDDIRLVSINGAAIKDLVDPSSGIILNLEKAKSYNVEFYVGTYYYMQEIPADTHFLQAYEYYYYDSTNVQDTKLSYLSFETPETLKSGWYDVEGAGVFLYYAYDKGSVPEDVSLNESYYKSEQEQILQYTRQYSLNIPIETRDLVVTAYYLDPQGEMEDVGGFLISPEGVVYSMEHFREGKLLSVNLATAKQGEWTIGIYPRELEVSKIETTQDEIQEETVCEESEFTLTEAGDYKAIYASISGKGEVYGTVIAEDGRTFIMEPVAYKDSLKREVRYVVCRIPYMAPGTYRIKIYHYQSETEIGDARLLNYDPITNELKFE